MQVDMLIWNSCMSQLNHLRIHRYTSLHVYFVYSKTYLTRVL